MTDAPHTCGLAMMLEVKVQEDRFYLPGTTPSSWRALCVVLEVLVWPEKRAVSIDTLNTSYCRSQHRKCAGKIGTECNL